MGDLKFSSFYSISLRVSAFWKTWPPRTNSGLFDWGADIGVDEPTPDHSFQQAMTIPSFEVCHLQMVVDSRSSLDRYPNKITIALLFRQFPSSRRNKITPSQSPL